IAITRADAQDNIGFARDTIRSKCARHADGAEVLRMVVREGAFARLGFAHRNSCGRSELRQRGVSFAVEYSATGHDQRFPAFAEKFGGARNQELLGLGAWNMPDAVAE